MRQQVVQFAIDPQFDFQPPIGIPALRWQNTFTFWELLELPFREAIAAWWLLMCRSLGEYAIESYTEFVPVSPQTVGYIRREIDFEEIVEQTHQLMRHYSRRTGLSPTLIVMGQGEHIDFLGAYQTQFPFNYDTNWRGPDGSISHWYRGMRVVLCPDIEGILVLGEDELNFQKR